jgi:hypothetical protein
MLCFADATGEALAGILRPGNAGANTAADHVSVLDEAMAQLPQSVRAGHLEGDDASLVEREVIVATDAAGSSKEFVGALRARNIKFMTVASTTGDIRAAIFDAEGLEGVWHPAIGQDNELLASSSVCELTSLMALASWPERTRLIVRREPLHPGAQRSLFPSMEFRYWGFYTDCDGDAVTLDTVMRAHAHVENHIGRLKDSGLMRFPFTKLAANAAWLQLVLLAADLVRWFSCSAVTPIGARRAASRCAGGSSTLRAGSCIRRDDRSCASSSTGRTPRPSSPPTGASISSAEASFSC